MLLIPTQAVPSQTISVSLGGQACSINLYAKTSLFDPAYNAPSAVLFCDLYVAGALVIAGVPCWHANRVVRDAYLGFVGDLAVYDVSGAGQDPAYAGLGDQWQLIYLTQADLEAAGFTA